MKIPQHLKDKWNKFLNKTIEETDDYILGKDRFGKYIKCKRCGLQSYCLDDVENKMCSNCKFEY